MVEKELMHSYKVFIPCAGIGSRLGSLVANINKGLVSVDNKPVLSHIIDKFDEDIEIGIMRFSPTQKRRSIHRFQLFYAPFLYGLMTIYWCSAKDFIQLFRYDKKELLEGQGLTFTKGFIQILLNKIWYFALLLAVPFLLVELPWWQSLIGFGIMHFICGLILSFIFLLIGVSGIQLSLRISSSIIVFPSCVSCYTIVQQLPPHCQ